jgi:glycosyltransferase involved in cell wall biosynthesis
VSRRPLVSVCVSTKNRAHLLTRLLAALEAQTLSRESIELVVTDDGSTDGTAHILDSLAASSPIAMTVLRHEHSLGPAAGRNSAWRAARGGVIAFTDDDCVPVPRWLEQGLALVGDTPVVVVGRVEPDPAQTPAYGLFAHSWVMRAAEARWFATANCFYRRVDLEAVGGFDERFPNAACEDTALGLTVEHEVGAAVVFAASALVHHDVRRATVRDKVRDQARWAELALVLREHPEQRTALLYRGLFWKRSHADLLLMLLGAAGATRRPASLLLALPWLDGKLCRERTEAPLRQVVPALGGLLAVDLAELVAMIRGSVRHHRLIL